MAEEFHYPAPIDVGEAPTPGKSILVELPNPPSGYAKDEAFVFTLEDGQVVGYFNRCSHVQVPLDMGDGDFLDRSGFIMCRVHGARYDLATGDALLGPAVRGLTRLELALRDGRIIVTGWKKGRQA
jgi:3-phenylpropionate/trans-cinnamate dioxygenase ferredoxin subunit